MADKGLDFVNLHLDTTRLVLITDVSFPNARDMKSLVGDLILMFDADNKCNFVHFGSNRCNLVARSFMAAKLLALFLGFDYAFVVKDLLAGIMGCDLSLQALIHSKTVFNIVVKQSQTN